MPEVLDVNGKKLDFPIIFCTVLRPKILMLESGDCCDGFERGLENQEIG